MESESLVVKARRLGPRMFWARVCPLAASRNRERDRETTFTYLSYAFSFRLIIRLSLELKRNNVVVVSSALWTRSLDAFVGSCDEEEESYNENRIYTHILVYAK